MPNGASSRMEWCKKRRIDEQHGLCERYNVIPFWVLFASNITFQTFSHWIQSEVIIWIQLSGFEKTQTSLDDLLSFFGKFPNVLNVTKRLYEDRKDPERKKHFKGSVFVVFKDKESAQNFMDLDSLKSPDEKEELIRKWQKGNNIIARPT